MRPLNIITIEGVSCPVNRIVSSGAPGSLFHPSLELRCWGSYTENYGLISPPKFNFCIRYSTFALGDVGNSTLEFHNAALKFQNTTLISHNAALFVHTWFFLHLFESESVIRHACGSFYVIFTHLKSH